MLSYSTLKSTAAVDTAAIFTPKVSETAALVAWSFAVILYCMFCEDPFAFAVIVRMSFVCNPAKRSRLIVA